MQHTISVDSYTLKGKDYECKCSVVGMPKQKETHIVTAHLSSNYVRNCDALSDIINQGATLIELPQPINRA